jgi:hypothetical protein
MKILTSKRTRKIIIALAIIVLSLGLIAGACAIYVSDYYHADLEAIAAHADVCGGYSSVSFPNEKTVVFTPENAKAGLILYPGGKVEFTAYLPLMAACAERGILCVIVKMPANLAVLDANAADGIKEQYPEIDSWYIGGHSLGGSMAASYVSKNADDFDGLILLGAYSTADLSSLGVKVLSVYGSEDKVMNREKYAKYKNNLPKELTEHVIDGGCHAYFGMYGKQDGDGEPTISNEEQINVTADLIAKLIFE